MEKLDNKIKYIDKLKPVLRKNRFSQINMDDLARHMDISKATLYKYFSSKDEIIEMFVDFCVNYFKQADETVMDEGISYIDRFHNTYEQSVIAAISVPDILLQDLKSIYPALFEKLDLARLRRHKKLQQFIEEGMENGVFNRIDPTLFIVQDEVLLRHILEPSFSIQYDLTLKQALFEFYILEKVQLFKPEIMGTVDDSVMEKTISRIILHMFQGM